ncbi:DUF4232 domain-containing protein [Nonomuraea sp. SBT364]|uniref:DUF4232 domain-containing protein n=1 Tax=Nonomuraea sp. SBT364 TaxID=1580530 RepID=UPI00066DEED3|nr:DUF4232 domain-containing protein [Nonomuraea sp. SBT364]
MRIPYVLFAVVLGLAGCGTRTSGALQPPPTPAPSSHLARPTPIPSVHVGRPAPGEARCPRSGMRLTAEETSAAMGLRAQGMILTNCGKRVRRVTGYPAVSLLDEDGGRLKVSVDRGARQVTTAVEAPGPRTLTLRPGRSARFGLVWRNTYDDPSRPPVNGATLVVSVAGARLSVDTPVDLGSTGRLGVTAWAYRQAGPCPSRRAHRIACVSPRL